MDQPNYDGLVQLTAEIVAAYVTNNRLDSDQIGNLIEQIHTALHRAPTSALSPERTPAEPAVPVEKSVTPDFIISLEDGRKFRTLRRYLNKLGMTPDEYRAKWGLSRQYPMVAPNYAKQRSEIAKKLGLGRKPASQAPEKKTAKARNRIPRANATQ